MKEPAPLGAIVWPALFAICTGYLFWYLPKLIVRFGWASDALALRFAPAGPIDFAALIGACVALVLGARSVQPTAGEGEILNGFDRLSLFLGRTTMLLIFVLVLVMFYEVVLRYVFEAPTLWANELSLWIAGFIFLLAGLYAMQQRSHIRIYLLYDVLPRPVQRACDVVSTALILVFALSVIWGGYNEAAQKFMRWETFGTAFDPPLPATLKPMLLLIILLVAIQAIANLIADWNKPAERHGVIDEDEITGVVYPVERHDTDREQGGRDV